MSSIDVRLCLHTSFLNCFISTKVAPFMRFSICLVADYKALKMLTALGFALTLMGLSWPVYADECPQQGEAVVTTHYRHQVTCWGFIILIEGEMNPEKYQACLGLVPSASEQVALIREDGKAITLPRVNSMLPNHSELKDRLWIVGIKENGFPRLQCKGGSTFAIDYYAGGNCQWCERTVLYQVNPQGNITSTQLQ